MGQQQQQKQQQQKQQQKAAAKEVVDSDDEEEDEEEEESEAGDAEDESGEESGDVDVDFEFYDPKEDDYHSVGDFLKNGTWQFAPQLNYAEMADSVVGQGNIGTLIKSGNEKDPEK